MRRLRGPPTHQPMVKTEEVEAFLALGQVSGSPRDSHPRAPTDPCVNLSIHTALTIQSGRSGASVPSARTGRGHVG
jgi:hypothetical protein